MQLEQLMQMPFLQIENLHKEILNRLRKKGFSVQQQIAAFTMQTSNHASVST